MKNQNVQCRFGEEGSFFVSTETSSVDNTIMQQSAERQNRSEGSVQIREYRYEDLQIGMREEFTVTITDKMLSMFHELTGDFNPLHCSREFALEHQYPDRVVYGMLTASLISTLGGVYLPGKYCLIHSVESKFLRPVFVGDTLTVYGEITALHDAFRRIEIKVWIKNQNQEKVLRGILKAGVLHE